MPRRTLAQIEADMLARLSEPMLDRKGRHCACCKAGKPVMSEGWRCPEPGTLVCPKCWADWCSTERLRQMVADSL